MYYFFFDIINIKNLDPYKTKIDQKSYKYYFYYIRYAISNSVILLYLLINKTNGCLEENNGIKYLTHTLTV